MPTNNVFFFIIYHLSRVSTKSCQDFEFHDLLLKETYYAFWGFLCSILRYISPCACKGLQSNRAQCQGQNQLLSLTNFSLLEDVYRTRLRS